MKKMTQTLGKIVKPLHITLVKIKITQSNGSVID